MRIAWFSPLPPTPSGIADYSADLLSQWASVADVIAFYQDRVTNESFLRTASHPVSVRRLEGLVDYRAEPHRCDAAFYHLGNNPYHEFVYRHAITHPGIVVLHDLVLHHLVARFADRKERLVFEGALEEEHGETGRRLAALKRVRIAGGMEQFLFPLTDHVVRRSLGVVVHSEFARDRIAPMSDGVPIEVIPHHSGVPPPEIEGLDRDAARRRLGLPQDAFMVGHVGFMTPEKQPDAVIEGFAQLHRVRPDAVLVVVGSAPEGEGNLLTESARGHGMEDAVLTTGYVDVVGFNLALIASDVLVNLRYPSAGETSGTVCRALGHGRPVVVSNYAAFGDFPDDIALKVEVDGEQADELAGHLLLLAEDEGSRRERGRRAREYARAVLSPERCRDAYVAFAERVAARAS